MKARAPEGAVVLGVYVGGVASIAVGCGLIFPPAGLIVGGLVATASALFYARGGGA